MRSALGSTHTIGNRIQDAGGYTSGFDYMRLLLAVSVLYGHSFVVTGDSANFPAWWGVVESVRSYMLLPMFFSLSGFLVAASLERVTTLRTFLMLRAIRIAPALAVEILLSAFILGPLLTNFPLSRYFNDPHFFLYFLNMGGWPHYILPGVFTANHLPDTVNGSLWTVPYEAECYIALVLLAVTGVLQRPRLMVCAILAVCAMLLCYFAIKGDPQPWRGTATGRQLVIFFLAGVMIYRLRNVVPFSEWAALGSLVVCALTVRSHVLIYVCPFFAAYLTTYLGLLRPQKLPVLFTGDYSYGIYLYAFPIQQALFQASPIFRLWWTNCTASLVLVGCFAAFSWHAIEKPALKLKRFVLSRNERGYPARGDLISPDKTRESVAMAQDGQGAEQPSLIGHVLPLRRSS